MKFLKSKKMLVVILIAALAGAYFLGRQSNNLSEDYVNKEWNKLSPETKEMIKESVVKIKERIKEDVCK